jgi:hypothetical protein
LTGIILEDFKIRKKLYNKKVNTLLGFATIAISMKTRQISYKKS